MDNENLIREIATKACREAMQDYLEEIAEGVARRLQPALTKQIPGMTPVRRSKDLSDGASLIAGARSQSEALESLLAATAAIAPKCGLMILRGGQAVGWNCQGLTSIENFKHAVLDCTSGVGAKAVSGGVAAAASELDSTFRQRLGLGNSEQLLLVPVFLKERVAAILVAVPSSEEDLAGLEVLSQVARLTLELQSYRKVLPQAAAASQDVRRPAEAQTAVPVTTRTEAATFAAAASATGTRAEASAAAGAGFAPASSTQYSAPVAAVAPVQVVAPVQAAPVLDEVHEKARRFAKLLVEEIKLYNQAKVAEGRARGDLYSRLQEDIEKSRAAYQKRYGESVRDVDFFTQELLRILADNNRAVMGAGFPG